jgi:lysophospholipase L1-like esterase
MRTIFVIIFIIVALLLIASVTHVWQFAKTIWLIVQVTPYEQKGTGDNPPAILVLGDSTGYGTGAGSGNKSIAGLLGAEFLRYSITNMSKNGRTIGEALDTIKSLPADQTYELILLQLGGNDILQKRPLAVVEGELRQLFLLAHQHSAQVVMLSCGNVGTAARFVHTAEAIEYDQLTRQFRALFTTVATEASGTYVDVFQEPDVDVFAQEPDVYLAIDGLHPSAAGYAVWYQKLEPVLQKLLHN